ncbi:MULTISPECIES: N-formylglutamate amidohydrolase [unclassified Novosphingobium]|uniref:N-formylglutamate amidohydrolase n=1 Tax=unclassified Novosphingobium TaxID=2644732 RepID=UPI000EE8B12D|nr:MULTISPECIES: N-formylglutamate amidohydrolase [unclassified Novosphingobium]HCF24586.1 N-formylglutamate amidohydrolase [Novosphingobium sp.]HQV03684.1 N-formylglutamate amidohydrolase [Novosphingobium sp.]
MDPDQARPTDSPLSQGGTIPGSEGSAAFSLTFPAPSALPLLIAVPHAGRAYPGSLLERMRNPGFAALKLEDRYVDRLAVEVARQTGAALLVAHAPRAMIDLNRDTRDVDWDMFARGRPDTVGSFTPGMRARSGLGLIPRRIPGLGELWKRRHETEELLARIATIHAPYHECLGAALGELRERWGAALLLDLHSMPPLGYRGGPPAPEFVLGDRFGTSCHGALVGSCFGYFAEMRRDAAHNRPYAGGYVLERHAAPGEGVHALQLEIDRSSYLDSRLAEPGDGFAEMVRLLCGLVRRLSAEVAELGRAANWANAAE